eukprot:gene3840-1601_t
MATASSRFPLGDTVINDICARTCNACPTGTPAPEAPQCRPPTSGSSDAVAFTSVQLLVERWDAAAKAYTAVGSVSARKLSVAAWGPMIHGPEIAPTPSDCSVPG